MMFNNQIGYVVFCDPKDEEIFMRIHKQNQKVNLSKVKGNEKIIESYKKLSEEKSFKPAPKWSTD